MKVNYFAMVSRCRLLEPMLNWTTLRNLFRRLCLFGQRWSLTPQPRSQRVLVVPTRVQGTRTRGHGAMRIRAQALTRVHQRRRVCRRIKTRTLVGNMRRRRASHIVHIMRLYLRNMGFVFVVIRIRILGRVLLRRGRRIGNKGRRNRVLLFSVNSHNLRCRYLRRRCNISVRCLNSWQLNLSLNRKSNRKRNRRRILNPLRCIRYNRHHRKHRSIRQWFRLNSDNRRSRHTRCPRIRPCSNLSRYLRRSL